MAVSKRLRYEILRRDNHACRYCGATAPGVPLTVDHVVPVSLGGSDDPENLVAACRECNSGKSSSNPDAPLVATVADDAVRWSKAMELVAFGRAVGRAEAKERHAAFEAHWQTWTYTYKLKPHYFELPFNWKRSVDQFLDAGLEMDDLCELVDVAVGTPGTDVWRYFCGCCWRRIREAQEHARNIIALQEERDG